MQPNYYSTSTAISQCYYNVVQHYCSVTTAVLLGAQAEGTVADCATKECTHADKKASFLMAHVMSVEVIGECEIIFS
jgi:hypothetical protein